MTVKSLKNQGNHGNGILAESVLTDLDGLGGLVLLAALSPFVLIYSVMKYGWHFPPVAFLLPLTCLCLSMLCTIVLGNAVSRVPNNAMLKFCLVIFQLLSLASLIWSMVIYVKAVFSHGFF